MPSDYDPVNADDRVGALQVLGHARAAQSMTDPPQALLADQGQDAERDERRKCDKQIQRQGSHPIPPCVQSEDWQAQGVSFMYCVFLNIIIDLQLVFIDNIMRRVRLLWVPANACSIAVR